MNRKTEELRNSRLIEDYENGLEMRLISAFYGLTNQRIYQILKRYKVKTNRRLDKKTIVC